MKRVLEEDLHITLSQLDMEATATIRTIEELTERCCLLAQDIERQLSQLDTHPEQVLTFSPIRRSPAWWFCQQRVTHSAAGLLLVLLKHTCHF